MIGIIFLILVIVLAISLASIPEYYILQTGPETYYVVKRTSKELYMRYDKDVHSFAEWIETPEKATKFTSHWEASVYLKIVKTKYPIIHHS